jgi:hypothetical protein
LATRRVDFISRSTIVYLPSMTIVDPSLDTGRIWVSPDLMGTDVHSRLIVIWNKKDQKTLFKKYLDQYGEIENDPKTRDYLCPVDRTQVS